MGVLLLCNFGDRDYLDVPGLEPGAGRRAGRAPHGSCIAVCATDAPLSAQQLRRLALRPLLGPRARRAPTASEGSGEIGVAFATATGAGPAERRSSTRYFAAAYEAAHEAVYNCLVAARPARRLDGTMQEPFPLGRPSSSELDPG